MTKLAHVKTTPKLLRCRIVSSGEYGAAISPWGRPLGREDAANIPAIVTELVGEPHPCLVLSLVCKLQFECQYAQAPTYRATIYNGTVTVLTCLSRLVLFDLKTGLGMGVAFNRLLSYLPNFAKKNVLPQIEWQDEG